MIYTVAILLQMTQNHEMKKKKNTLPLILTVSMNLECLKQSTAVDF